MEHIKVRQLAAALSDIRYATEAMRSWGSGRFLGLLAGARIDAMADGAEAAVNAIEKVVKLPSTGEVAIQEPRDGMTLRHEGNGQIGTLRRSPGWMAVTWARGLIERIHPQYFAERVERGDWTILDEAPDAGRALVRPGAVQPPPKATNGPHVADLVVADVQERKRAGVAKYGVALQAFNGRDPLRDAYEECLDQAHYLKQAIEERREEAAERRRLEAELDEARKALATLRAERDAYKEAAIWWMERYQRQGVIVRTATDETLEAYKARDAARCEVAELREALKGRTEDRDEWRERAEDAERVRGELASIKEAAALAWRGLTNEQRAKALKSVAHFTEGGCNCSFCLPYSAAAKAFRALAPNPE